MTNTSGDLRARLRQRSLANYASLLVATPINDDLTAAWVSAGLHSLFAVT